jgi:hypothetical protein
MGTSYNGLIQGNMNVVDVAKAILRLYGGDNFNIRFSNEGVLDFGLGLGAGIDQGGFALTFDEELKPEIKALRPWERKNHRIHRNMQVMVDGSCACDYEDVTKEPMTYVSLGHWGECKEIVDALVAHFGGYVKDEAGSQEWEPLTQEAKAAAQARTAALQADRQAYEKKVADRLAA